MCCASALREGAVFRHPVQRHRARVRWHRPERSRAGACISARPLSLKSGISSERIVPAGVQYHDIGLVAGRKHLPQHRLRLDRHQIQIGGIGHLRTSTGKKVVGAESSAPHARHSRTVRWRPRVRHSRRSPRPKRDTTRLFHRPAELASISRVTFRTPAPPAFVAINRASLAGVVERARPRHRPNCRPPAQSASSATAGHTAKRGSSARSRQAITLKTAQHRGIFLLLVIQSRYRRRGAGTIPEPSQKVRVSIGAEIRSRLMPVFFASKP